MPDNKPEIQKPSVDKPPQSVIGKCAEAIVGEPANDTLAEPAVDKPPPDKPAGPAVCKPADDKPAKDRWDKAEIVSTFFSSVVIAVVGLAITYLLHNAQTKSAESIAAAQRDSSERMAKAQVEQAKQIADGQRKVQEGTLTAQLIEHLASTNETRKQLAIVALDGAVPDERFQRILADVRARDQSAAVVKTAENVSAGIDQRLINGLRPEAADLARRLLELARAKNIELRVLAGYRSPEEQQALLDRGVTRARWSTHTTGLAFDVGIFDDGKLLSDPARYKVVGELGKQLGLVWGGDWKPFADTPHFETKDAQSELAKLRQQAGG